MGFLPWNFHPAKIFMGDSGSMLLGMLLAIATISGVARNSRADRRRPGGTLGASWCRCWCWRSRSSMSSLAIVRRTRRGQGIGHADKEHIHHRLMEIGHGHRQAVLLMYLWSALISACALAVGLIDGRLAVGLILFGGAALFLVTALASAHPRPQGQRVAQRRSARTTRHAGCLAGQRVRSCVSRGSRPRTSPLAVPYNPL